MKDNGWKGFICARCGKYGKNIHLHHIVELVHGGENVPENVIPLCSACHSDWDYFPDKYPFEQFLVTMPGMLLPLSSEMATIEGADMFSTRAWIALCASVYRATNIAKASYTLEDDGWLASDIEYNQNQFFSKYPYSDYNWRANQLKQAYGELGPMQTIIESKMKKARVV
jgi:hypothetical protein